MKVKKRAALPRRALSLLRDMKAVACRSWPKCLTEEMRSYRCFCCRARDMVDT